MKVDRMETAPIHRPQFEIPLRPAHNNENTERGLETHEQCSDDTPRRGVGDS